MKKQLHVTIHPQPPSGAGPGADAATTVALNFEAKSKLVAVAFGSGDERANASRSGTGGTCISSITFASEEELAIRGRRCAMSRRYEVSIAQGLKRKTFWAVFNEYATSSKNKSYLFILMTRALCSWSCCFLAAATITSFNFLHTHLRRTRQIQSVNRY
jgi:hypothetical protein